MNSLELIETMSVLSTRMVDAARATEWDQLVALERDMAAIRVKLVRLDATGRQGDELSDAEQTHRMSLIASILDNEREIRRHVDPWLESTRKLLAGTVQDRAVRAAYGAFGP